MEIIIPHDWESVLLEVDQDVEFDGLVLFDKFDIRMDALVWLLNATLAWEQHWLTITDGFVLPKDL